MGGESRDLPQGDSFQSGGEILLKLPGDAPPFLLEASLGQLSFLDHQAEPQAQKGNARQKNRREKEEDLSPVRLKSHGPESPSLELPSI